MPLRVYSAFFFNTRLSSPLFIFTFVSVALAHPGEAEEHDTFARRQFLTKARRSTGNCQEQIAICGPEAKAIERCAALANEIRAKRGFPLHKRTFEKSLSTSHHSDKTDLTP